MKVIVVFNRDHLKQLPQDMINQLKERVEMLGGCIGNHAYNNVQVWLPLGKIEELAEWDEIRIIKLPTRPATMDIQSEGVTIGNVNVWQDNGVTGEGVKVGVLDFGFKDSASLLGTELPVDTTVAYTGTVDDFYSDEHGTACAEIVHDIAPDADMFLINVDDMEVDYSIAVNWLKSQGVEVISSSIGINLKTLCMLIYDTLYDPLFDIYYATALMSYINQIEDQWNETIDETVHDGITWCQAAGNDGQKKWQGDFNDSDGDFYHNFTSTENFNEIELRQDFQYGEEVYVLMLWDMENAGSTYDDFDLYVTNELGFIECYSNILQSLHSIGWEACKFTPIPNMKYYAYVYQYSVTPQEITLFIGHENFPSFKHWTPEKTVLLCPPAYNPNALTVGAVPMIIQIQLNYLVHKDLGKTLQ